ncbi:hypothetical protein GOV03_01310 [Candidatus Woesearchaeota archaeon]|nr:hypothetical protein [Candidatus Woesearchaeota archaeon]
MENKAIFFDTGPIISLVMSRLVWILPKLKEQFGGKFYITPSVRKELIDRPMKVKRFQFEALQVSKLIKDGVLEIYKDIPQKKAKELENIADTSFKIKNKNLDIIQVGEMESVVSALKIGAEAVVMDERTLRLFIENGLEMKKLLEYRFKRTVTPNLAKIKQFGQQLKGIKIIRSIELVGVAYKLGILNDYIPKLKEGKKSLLDAVLWATKFNGCAVTGHEIEELKQYLLK